ncbi:MAG: hypothetical protein H8E55_21095 [Pelagibacterales bacterium]|nr:hypothetical protein [Pelagibacterales bacterium]
MYGDTVFHPDTLAEFNDIKDDVVVTVDSVWKRRFLGRSKEDITLAETLDVQPYGEVEYTGLIKFSPRVMEWILQKKDNYNSTSSFIDLLSDLRIAGFKISSYDVSGNWAEMNEPTDLVHFILGSKAETLRRIQPKLTKSKVCDQITCNWHYWKSHPEKVIKDVQSKFGGQRLIVRSSSVEEDGWETAQAGVFESILNVDSDNIEAVRKAIEYVFLSYKDPTSNTQVLIQPFVTDVMMSGVIFTCDMVTGAPYYIINYDDVSGKTDTITSGNASSLRTTILFRHEINNVLSIDPRLKKVIDAVQELERLLGYNKLDIEFAIDKNDQCFTFQIRPITVNHKQYKIDDKDFGLHLQEAQQKFISLQEKPPHIFGNYTIFSRMTDWNPAEIIGTRPNALAINLYSHLITEKIWAKQRAEFGYRDIRPAPLVYNFCAQPYVDCRASINSFIPADLTEDCASRLVSAYLDLLRKNPHLHDKLELEVVFTIWVPTFSEDAKERFKDQNVSAKDLMELEKVLKKLTANALVRLDKDTSSIDILSKNFELLMKSDLKPVDKVYQLIVDCRRFGTLAFAHAARAGFVAVTLLKSLVKLGNLSQDRMLEFQGSIPTVASDFQTALSNNLSVDELVKKFGHLRPGTYDVNQLAYWEKPNFYFISNNQNNLKQDVDRNKFVFNQQELQGFQDILDELSIEIEVHDFIKYLKKAIQARESTKFDFTRNLSVALDLMIKYGIEELGLTREDVGYLTFDDIIGIQTDQLNKKQIKAFVKLRKTNFSEKHLAKIPSFISDEKDFFGYEQEKSEANFITRLNVVADLLFIKSNQRNVIKGKIVAIPNADPGFDWIFSHNIVGLVTQYGGANSHMAIRCAELGIPAAIGIGDKLYEGLHEGRLMLDCQKGRLEYV